MIAHIFPPSQCLPPPHVRPTKYIDRFYCDDCILLARVIFIIILSRFGPVRIEEIPLARSIRAIAQGIVANVSQCYDVSRSHGLSGESLYCARLARVRLNFVGKRGPHDNRDISSFHCSYVRNVLSKKKNERMTLHRELGDSSSNGIIRAEECRWRVGTGQTSTISWTCT